MEISRVGDIYELSGRLITQTRARITEGREQR